MRLFYQKRTSSREDMNLLALPGPAPDNDADVRLYHHILTVGIDTQLPEPLRQVTELYYVQGLRQAEIARLLGIDRSTVQRRLKRSLAILRGFARGCLLAGIREEP